MMYLSDYSAARDAVVCVVTAGETQQYNQDDEDVLRKNFEIFKSLIPNVCKFAPNSILVIVSSPGKNDKYKITLKPI